MEGVSSLPADLHKADVERTMKELTKMNNEVEQALKQVCLSPSSCIVIVLTLGNS